MDFVAQQLGDFRAFRLLNVLANLTREGLSIEVDSRYSPNASSQPGQDHRMARQARHHWVDSGQEYIREKLMKWASSHGVNFQSGQPQLNVYIERCSRTVRHEWLDQYIIERIEEAQDHSTQWL